MSVFTQMRKNTDMCTKNTHMSKKILLLLICFILPFTKHVYFSMRIFACLNFYACQRIKYGHGMRIFQAFIKNFFAV